MTGKSKGICIVLKDHGLWNHYQAQDQSLGKSFVGKCADCKKSGLAQDAKQRAAHQVKEAKANVLFMDPNKYFLNQDRETQEALQPDENIDTTDTFPASDFILFCGHKALRLQSYFLN